MGARAHPLPPVLSLVPGETLSWDLRIRNTGSRVDEFTFQVLGDGAKWTSITPPTLSLLPKDEGTARLEIRAPRDPAVRAGTMAFGVRVVSGIDPDDTTIQKTALEVAPFIEVAAEVSPTSARARRVCEYRLGVSNLGNIDGEATVAAQDPDDDLVLTTRPATTAVAPGQRAAIHIGARARRRLWFGRPKSLPFSVAVQLNASGLDSPPATAAVEATCVQTPLVARWLVAVGAAAIALLGFISQSDPLSGLGLVLLMVLAIGVLVIVILGLVAIRLLRTLFRRRSARSD